MRLKESVKSITYMKTHAADILSTVSETQRPMIITHNGEGKMVIQDIESYQQMKEALALLKIVALGRESVEKGRLQPAKKAFDAIAQRRRQRAE